MSSEATKIFLEKNIFKFSKLLFINLLQKKKKKNCTGINKNFSIIGQVGITSCHFKGKNQRSFQENK